jgi:tRNA modification GTPase
MPSSSPSCSLLTPAGRGAIAVIAVFGEATDRLDSLFESATGKYLADAKDGAILYGRWRTTGEDVIVTKFADRWEVHSHGGQAAPAAILNSFVSAGFRLLGPEEAARNLCDNDWQAELVLAMGQAATERTAELLLRQFHLAPVALVQLENQLHSPQPSIRQEAQQTIVRCLEFARFGLHLTQPWTVVLCGRPNVGKSSLINALVGFERAIVHHEAGTTRDVVTQLTAVEGWPIELKDTAGLREANNEIERRGVEFAKTEIESADLVLAVFDAAELLTRELDWELAQANRAELVVVNKIDLLSPPEVEALQDSFARQPRPDGTTAEIIQVSAVNRQGIQQLVSAVARKLVPAIPEPDRLIPISLSQIHWLRSRTATDKSSDRDTAANH